jgi:hypothetical protein
MNVNDSLISNDGTSTDCWQKLISLTDPAKTVLLMFSSQVLPAQGANIVTIQHPGVLVNRHSPVRNGVIH